MASHNLAEQTQSDTRPRFALAARYDAKTKRLLVTLGEGIDLSLDPSSLQELQGAKPGDLTAIEISPSGRGLHFPKLDADIYLPALLEGITGTRAWMAAQLGARGGAAKSRAKAKASRENGRRGGRPRKTA